MHTDPESQSCNLFLSGPGRPLVRAFSGPITAQQRRMPTFGFPSRTHTQRYTSRPAPPKASLAPPLPAPLAAGNRLALSTGNPFPRSASSLHDLGDPRSPFTWDLRYFGGERTGRSEELPDLVCNFCFNLFSVRAAQVLPSSLHQTLETPHAPAERGNDHI